MKTPFDHDSLQEIIRHFDSDERLISLEGGSAGGPLSLESSFMLQPRLERAAMDQITDEQATVSRYAIWAETVRGIVLDALEKTDADVDTKRNLMRAANSLAAFSAIQWRIDSR